MLQEITISVQLKGRENNIWGTAQKHSASGKYKAMLDWSTVTLTSFIFGLFYFQFWEEWISLIFFHYGL